MGDTWADWLAGVSLAIAAGMKWAYWMRIDGEPREYTAEAALGLGHLGKVRPLEPPHTQPNFVMREMGYRVARKHALKLRNLALLLGFGLPDRPPAADHGCGHGVLDRWRSAGDDLDGGGYRHRALAVLRRGRARVDAVLRRRRGAACTLVPRPFLRSAPPHASGCIISASISALSARRGPGRLK